MENIRANALLTKLQTGMKAPIAERRIDPVGDEQDSQSVVGAL